MVKAYQLRGMATLAEYRGKGIGNQLVNFAIVYMRGRKSKLRVVQCQKESCPLLSGSWL